MKIAIILGTRPEIIKMSPIIRECERRGLDYFIIHTGQHYSYNLDRIFFHQLQLPEPRYNLNVGSGSHAEETGKMLMKIESVLVKEKPDVVLVEGDTNTVLSGALAASKLYISCKNNVTWCKIGHVEAGLRSYDRRMPEEINRILTDHISDYLFAPTKHAENILLGEGLPREKIFVTGNTIVDAVKQNLKLAKKTDVLEKLNVERKKYFLVTAHREENVDVEKRLRNILRGLELVHKEFGLSLIYPIHPRTEKRMREFKLKVSDGIRLIEPVGFLEFLRLEAEAKLVLTDSGGVEEETCILGVPCVTLRDSIDRPETLEVGSNFLAGVNPEKILDGVKEMVVKRNWENPFGDGRSGKRIIDILEGQRNR